MSAAIHVIVSSEFCLVNIYHESLNKNKTQSSKTLTLMKCPSSAALVNEMAFLKVDEG